MSSAELSAYASARLCHDLISPMGAIGNGLELLQMAEGAGSAELELINDSLATALGKLRFYRIAFGPGDSQARLSFDEARQITDAVFQGRFSVSWHTAEKSFARVTAKLIYLAILCIEKSLPMGGAVRVSVSESEVTLKVESTRISPPPGLWDHVTAGATVPELRSDNVQFPLFRNALAAGHRLEVSLSDSAMTLTLTPAPHEPD